MSDIKKFYDKDAAEYDEKRFDENDWQNMVHQKLLLEFLENLPNTSRILEIGCGTGRFTTTLTDYGFDTTAVDLSQSMVQHTRQRFEQSSTETQPDLLNADVSNLPFDDGYFDSCIMINVASHLPNPRKAFSEISRVVKDDGRIFVNFTNLFSPYFPIGLIVNLRGQSVQENVFSRWYSWREISDIIADSSLVVDKIRGHMIPPRNENKFINNIVKIADKVSRDSLLRYFAGNRFYHLRNCPSR